MKYFLNDWCEFDSRGDVVLNNYPQQFSHYKYIDALAQQARDIYDHTGVNTLFISGGIDSHTKALAYIKAGIDCKLVFVKNSFDGHDNSRELFYAEEFCKKHGKELFIFSVDYDLESLERLLHEKNYFTSSIGSGNIFQYDAMEKYMDIYDEKILVGIGYFYMQRKDNLCWGSFLKPNYGLMKGLDLNRILLFDTYAPHIYKYYEYAHRTNTELQVLKRFAGKNLSFTELGMQLRPKLSSWEFLDSVNDYSRLSSIDWAEDHSDKARMTVGIETIANIFGYSQSQLDQFRQSRSFDVNNCYVKLYEFTTKIDFTELNL